VTAVLVSHPHVAAFATGLAQGLAEANKLAGYYTGLVVARDTRVGDAARWLSGRWPVLKNRILPGMPPQRLHPMPAVEALARMTGRALKNWKLPVSAYDLIFGGHDAAVSLMAWPRETTAVYAYEDGALLTFRKAARLGLERVWDLPLPHYRTIEHLLRDEASRWPDAGIRPPRREPDWKQRRKDAELALATKVSVASAFTWKSLEQLDVRAPVVVVPYGFPVDQFPARVRHPSGPFRVLAVGTHDLRKGTPYLLEAWRRAQIPDAELHLVGPLRLAKTFLDRYAGTFHHRPHIPKSELGGQYAAADVLAFPTLGDGFGLVIQEAMCCGTPVITTPCGGGPECITDGVDGWILPPRDLDALIQRLRDCAADRDHTYSVGQAARARAERWTWREAGAAAVRALGF
jgi:glycosyltransferase involved in cell wall biosynthesis